MLEVKRLNAWYGESHILHGVDFEVREGEVVTLLGRNGAVKTTTLKSIMGLVPRREGSISYRGRELVSAMPNQIARSGIAFCPEERGIFGSLSVTENLMLPPVVAPGGLGIDEIYTLFRRGTNFSASRSQAPAAAYSGHTSRPRRPSCQPTTKPIARTRKLASTGSRLAVPSSVPIAINCALVESRMPRSAG